MKDPAIVDLERLDKAVKALHKASREVYGIVSHWGTRRAAADTGVADPESDMWCRSCMTIRHFAPRRKAGGVDCDWCATTLRELNQARGDRGLKALTELPPQAIKAHAEGRRVYVRDLERWSGVKDIRATRNQRRKSRLTP